MLLFCKINIAHATEISPIIGLGQENFTFIVDKYTSNSKELKFEPNIAGVLRLGVNAFGFGIGYSFRGSEKDTRPDHGVTTFSDWQLGYHTDNWGIDGFYQVYTGFFSESPNQIQTFPNLTFKNYGLLARFAVQESNFTISGLVDQADLITTTDSKVYFVGGLSQNQMNTDVSLLQQEFAGLNPEFEQLRVLKSFSVKFGVGGGKYWVSENQFFVGGLVDLISTYSNYEYENDALVISKYSDLTTSYNIKAAFGYAGSNIRSGVGINGDVTSLMAPGKVELKPSSNRLHIYLRYVF